MAWLTPIGWLNRCEAGGRSSSSPKADWHAPRVAPFPHGRIRGGRPNRRARCPGGYPRDADSICGQSTISHDAKPSTSPSVSRSGLQAQTGLRRLNCSMPRETRFCPLGGARRRVINDRWARGPTGQQFGHRSWIVEPLRLFPAYHLAGASHDAAEELDPPSDQLLG